jgi:tellurite resistance-related uncharacterized protein
MPKGNRVLNGAVPSEKYPGFYQMADGSFKKLTIWQGKAHNEYFSELACCWCEDLFLIHKSKRHKRGAYCSKACWTLGFRAENRDRSYAKPRPGGDHHVLVLRPSHPRANKKTGTVPEHILVAEAVRGAPISLPEVVHHINCVKHDNRPSNLVVCKDSAEHFRAHGSLNRCVARLLDAGVLRFNFSTMEYEVCI